MHFEEKKKICAALLLHSSLVFNINTYTNQSVFLVVSVYYHI